MVTGIDRPSILICACRIKPCLKADLLNAGFLVRVHQASIVLVADVSPEIIQQGLHEHYPLKSTPLCEGNLLFYDPFRLMPALLAFKGADFQILDGMGRPSNQMRIAAALLTAKRCNKFLILRKYGMLFHTRPVACSASTGHSRHPSAIAPHSAVPSPDR